MRWFALLPLLLAHSLLAAGECPFLNAATAAGIMGAAVQAGKTATEDSCLFAAKLSELRIQVTAKPAKHPAGCATLTGIGNEAVACGHKQNAGQRAEQVFGRVRGQFFEIRLTTSDPALVPSLRDKAQLAAEMVAGNLF